MVVPSGGFPLSKRRSMQKIENSINTKAFKGDLPLEIEHAGKHQDGSQVY
jgi:hypothetical protein